MRAALRAASKSQGRPEREEKIRRVLERACRDLDELEKDWRG
jgi:hypothetical protein